MATLEKSDLQPDANIQFTESGLSAARAFLVSGLSGDGPQRLIEALNVPGIPKYGDLYPGTSKCAAVDISATPAPGSTGKMRVIVKYKDITTKGGKPDDKAKPIVRVIARTVEVETEKDIKGEPLIVKYTQINEQMLGGSLQQVYQEKTYAGRAKYHLPVIGFRFERKESQAPTAKAKTYLGKVNKGQFFGYGARMLLVTELSGVTNDGGETYQVVYEIMVGPSHGWDAKMRYVDELSGKTPEDAEEGNGIATFQIYEEVDFGGMSLV